MGAESGKSAASSKFGPQKGGPGAPSGGTAGASGATGGAAGASKAPFFAPWTAKLAQTEQNLRNQMASWGDGLQKAVKEKKWEMPGAGLSSICLVLNGRVEGNLGCWLVRKKGPTLLFGYL
jgi:hypothetical protein